MELKNYDTADEMFSAIQEQTEALAKAPHIPVKEGDYVLAVLQRGPVQIPVFGHLESPLDRWQDQDVEALEGDARAEYEWERDYHQRALDSGFYFGRWYSVLVPKGELSTAHASTFVMTIEKEVFEQAQAHGWNIELRVASAGDA